jgi:hypothetical protein
LFLHIQVCCVACADGTLHCYHSDKGEYLVGPLMLKGAAVKMVAKNWLVAVVSMHMEFCMWDFCSRRNILRCDVSHLTHGEPLSLRLIVFK